MNITAAVNCVCDRREPCTVFTFCTITELLAHDVAFLSSLRFVVKRLHVRTAQINWYSIVATWVYDYLSMNSHTTQRDFVFPRSRDGA